MQGGLRLKPELMEQLLVKGIGWTEQMLCHARGKGMPTPPYVGMPVQNWLKPWAM